MTEQPNSQQRPPLRRSSTDRVIGGVCGGLARTLGIDPVIVRVITAVLAILGGAGIAAYIIAWILIPNDEGESALDQSRTGRGRFPQFVLVLLLAIAAVSIFHTVWPGGNDGLGFLVFILVAVVAWQAFGSDWFSNTTFSSTGQPPSGAGFTAPGATFSQSAQGEHVTYTSPTVSYAKGPDGETISVQSSAGTATLRKEPKSVLGRITWNLLAVAIGTMLALNWSELTHIPARMMIVVALAIVGVGLIVSAFAGRARGLIALGLLLAVLTVPSGHDVDGSMGDRTWTPLRVSELPADGFSLGIGSGRLDLSKLAAGMQPGQTVTVRAHVNIGELIVILPAGTTAHGVVSSHVQLGDVVVLGEPQQGGSDQSVRLSYGAADAPVTIDIDASVDIGQFTLQSYSNAPALLSSYNTEVTA